MHSLRLLGAADLVDSDGRRVDGVLRNRKQVALLAVLALSDGGVVRRDRLLGLLWPELPEERARNALSKALHGLRGALGAGALPSGPGDEVRLESGSIRCDVVDILAALADSSAANVEAALTRVAGSDLLAGFHVGDSPAFDEWLEAQRERLRRSAVGAALALAVDAERRGDAVAAVLGLEAAVELQPYDEDLVRRLMGAHVAAGDRAAAVSAYRRFSDRLKSELEVDPSAATQALADRIRVEHGASPVRSGDGTQTLVTVATRGAEALPTRRPPAKVRALGAILVTATALGLWIGRDEPTAAESARRVLVAPFEIDPAVPSLAGFDLVVADWITLSLSRAGIGEVVPARLAMARLGGEGGGRDASLALAREVGARWVMTGQVRVMADTFFVFPQILDSSREGLAQALEPVVGSVSDPGAVLAPLAGQITGAVASRLDARVPAAATGPARPPNYPAYVEFVAAIEPWAAAGAGIVGFERRDDFARAADHFRRAYELDPDFLALLPWFWEALTLSGAQDEAKAVLDEIVARRAELGVYETAVVDFLHAFRSGDREGAYEAARRRVGLAPYDGDAQWSLGWAALNTNRLDESLRAFEEAESSGGWMGDWANFVQWPARALHLRGDYEGEAALIQRFRERYPETVTFCEYGIRPLVGGADSDALSEAIDRCVREKSGDRVAVAEFLLGVSMELRAHGRAEWATRLADSVVTVLEPEIRAAPQLRGLRRIRFEALLVAGRWADLVEAVEQDPEPQVVWVNRWGPYGVAAAELGDSTRVEIAMRRLREGAVSSADTAWVHLRIGSILAHLGRLDEASSEIGEAIARGLSPAELFHAQRSLEPLEGHPPYELLVAPRR